MVSTTLTMGASLFPTTSLFSIARHIDTVNFRHSVHFFTNYYTDLMSVSKMQDTVSFICI